MSFWDTILGNQLARTLVKELPRLNDGKAKREEQINDLLNEIHSLRREVEELRCVVDEKIK